MKISNRATLGAALVLMVSLGGCGGSEDRTTDSVSSALVVTVDSLQLQQTHTAVQRFSGQVEAARQSALGFELGGELARVVVDEGDDVPAGTVLAELDQRRLQAALSERQAALRQAQAQAALTKATYQRIAKAREFDGVSPQELDEAAERKDRAAAALASASAGVSRIEIDITKAQIKAPYAASVIRRYADEGQVVAAGQPILDIQELAALRVRLSVTGDSLQTLQPGDRVALEINHGEVLATVVASIARRNSRTRAVEMIFDIDEGAAARVGDIAELRAERIVSEAGFWLPLDALSKGARSVWQVLAVVPLDERDAALARTTGATHRLENRPIEIIYEEAERVFARGALRDGDQIVANGLQRVVNGQGVRIANPIESVDLAEATDQ